LAVNAYTTGKLIEDKGYLPDDTNPLLL
jgi:hypothetical protein